MCPLESDSASSFIGTSRTFLIEVEEAGEDGIVGEAAGAPIVAPTVSLGHRFVDPPVSSSGATEAGSA